ncbi:ArsR family transcriptional regulator [Salinarchaeum sp. Harcht-Bsk1]|uniref:Lrp/AsnC family transcriptional regulator n=1 Tax=Salinarchaeum sp. Harcht-Bsk1 TaxID=1333523 RepID=UPI00034232D0|nr:Lrp/AsnC family transcriptional regulator [Salinarchaeum sp. Harcht-Bsk1]AGN00209.1 ArsR family transcriptional regulator [Salinarchaeum sp. Harcht-Bsk1]
MVHAFVMVKTAAGTSEGLVDTLRTVSPVTEAHIVAGEYDIIAEVDVEKVYDVLDTVANEMRSLEGVADTRTYISMK